MAIWEKIKDFLSGKNYPDPDLEAYKNYDLKGQRHFKVFENCAVKTHGKRVYLPLYCQYCKKYYCHEHHLPFNHNCPNIDEWKKTTASPAPVTEFRQGKIFVRK